MEKDIIIKIKDMKCAGCEATIRKALLRVKDVYDARANFKSGLVLLQVEEGFKISEADKIIRDLGYTPEEHIANEPING